MTTLSSYHNVDTANNFVKEVTDSENSYYVFAANEDSSNVPSANQYADGLNSSFYYGALFGKRISSSDITMMAKKNSWTSGTVYAQYDPAVKELSQNLNYFVVTSDNNVYKCISNNKGSTSTVKPSATIVNNNFQTQDGYIWKYLFTVSSANTSKFSFNNQYFPVEPNASVEAAAIPGTIDYVEVSNGGSGYIYYNTGSIQSVIDSNTVIIANTASDVTGAYVNSSITLKGSYGSDQVRKIIGYNGSTKTVDLESPIEIYQTITLSNTQGVFSKNSNVTQSYTTLTLSSGTLPVGSLVQQSPANSASACGTVIFANSSVAVIDKISGNNFTATDAVAFSPNTSYTTGANTITGTTASNTVTGSGTLFLSTVSAGDFIRIKSTGEFKRVFSVASDTSLTLASRFTSNFTSNNYSIMPGTVGTAADVSNTTITQATANITYTSTAVKTLIISGATGTFSIGDTLIQANTSSAIIANGTIIFANSTLLKVDSGNFTTSSPANTTIYNTQNVQATLSRVVNDDSYITVSDNTAPFFTSGRIATTTGNGYITSVKTIPDDMTEYVISPTVEITGDGSGFEAYAVVNTSTTSIESIKIVNRGSNYTFANAAIVVGSNAGNNAVISAKVSPYYGHGGDVYKELSAFYVGISGTLSNSFTQSSSLPIVGSFNSFGLVKNPVRENVWVHLTPLSRRLTLASAANAVVGGFIVQNNHSAVIAKIESNDVIVNDLNTSSAFQVGANVVVYTTGGRIPLGNITAISNAIFATGDNVQQVNTSIIDNISDGFGIIANNAVGSNNQVIEVANVSGLFTVGQKLYSNTSNSYASITSVKVYDNTSNADMTVFNQTLRLPLTSIVAGSYTNNDTVTLITDYGTNFNRVGTAKVFSTNTDVDISFTSYTGSAFPVGQKVFIKSGSTETGNAFVVYANTTYAKLTGLQGTIAATSNVYTSASAYGNVSTVYNTLILSNITGDWSNTSATNTRVTTNTAIAIPRTEEYIIYPDLVKGTGEVIYIENTSGSITRTQSSNNSIKLLIKF